MAVHKKFNRNVKTNALGRGLDPKAIVIPPYTSNKVQVHFRIATSQNNRRQPL